MANLYHNDIYKFEKPINSYWESTISEHGKYETFQKDLSTNCGAIVCSLHDVHTLEDIKYLEKK